MSLKHHSIASCLLLALLGSPAFADEQPLHQKGRHLQRPNILFIGVDDLRPELNCYGATHIKSPNIDRLAKEGVLFERAYCQWAVCMPSRASLLTGLRPDTFNGDARDWRKILPDTVTLPQHFKNNGYFTQSFGKIYHGSWETAYVGNRYQDPDSWSAPRFASSPRYYFSDAGVRVAREVFAASNDKFLRDVKKDPNDVDQWTKHFVRGLATEAPDVPDDLPGDGQITTAALQKLREMHDRRQPFFLAVGFMKPHLPFVAPKKYWDLYDAAKIPSVTFSDRPAGAPDFALKQGAGEVNQYVDKSPGLVSAERTRHLRHGYAACVSYVDAQIGKLLDELDSLGIRDDTVVVLWSDHGYKLGDFGAWAKHTNFELDTRVPLIVSAPGMSRGKRCQSIVELVDLHPTLSELAGLPVHEGAEGESFAGNVRRPETKGQDAAFSQFPKGGRMGYSIRTATHRYTEWRDPKNRSDVIRELYAYRDHAVERVNLADRPDHARVQRSLQRRLHTVAKPPQDETTRVRNVAAPDRRSRAAAPVRTNGLHAGAAAVNIDPPKFPVLQNGGFMSRTANKVVQPLFARSIVLENGKERIAICVVDSCMMDRELCDRAKSMVHSQIGIPSDRILVSATHTHTAPSVMRALGTQSDPEYPAFLSLKIAESIVAASESVRPAEAGFAVADAGDYTNNRRWIYLPHKMRTDPFGIVSVRAMMHPGYVNPDTAGPSGPEDPDLTLLSIRERGGGKPFAVLGNLSQHYMAQGSLSSGYTGRVCTLLEEEFGTPFVGLMSQGTSGDLQHMDYSRPNTEQLFAGEPNRYEAYCRGLSDLAIKTLKTVQYRSDCELSMAESRMKLNRRLPDEERIAWAKPIVEATGDALPKGRPAVYAMEAFWLQDHPEAEVVLQALRIGDLGIATLPNEVFAITGLRLKLHSPLPTLMNIELANGGAGYIPPPEQHHLGGYTTWPARTAGLETQAEPKIVDALLGLLEQVSGSKRRIPEDTVGSHGKKILALGPSAWWRMNASSGDIIRDDSSHEHDAKLEPGFALFLTGPNDRLVNSPAGRLSTHGGLMNRGNRAVHFAGGRMTATDLKQNHGDDYSVSMWIWNAMPPDARKVTGYFFSIGQDGNGKTGEHFGITGNIIDPSGRLLYYNGNGDKTVLVGKSKLQHQHWHHVLLVREGNTIRVFLDGNVEPEIEAIAVDTRPRRQSTVFVGGRSDGLFNFEGKIDEVAVFPRAISAHENPTH